MTIPSEWVVGAIAALGTIFSGLIGGYFMVRQKRIEREAAEMMAEREREAAREQIRQETEEKRWTRLEGDVERLSKQVDALRSDNEVLRVRLAEEVAVRTAQEDKIRDRDELIEDLITYLIVFEDWNTTGATPPRPVASWRVVSALRRRRSTMSGPIPLASDPPTSEED